MRSDNKGIQFRSAFTRIFISFRTFRTQTSWHLVMIIGVKVHNPHVPGTPICQLRPAMVPINY